MFIAPIGTEHLFCFISSDFANFSVMKLMLAEHSPFGQRSTTDWFIFIIQNVDFCSDDISLENDSDSTGLICSVIN